MVQELIQSHGLTIKDARTLVELDDGERLDYFDQVCEKLAELPFAPETPMGVDGKKRRNSGVVVANWYVLYRSSIGAMYSDALSGCYTKWAGF